MGSIPIDHSWIFIERLPNMIQKLKNLAYKFFSDRGLQLLYLLAYLKGMIALHKLSYDLTTLIGTSQGKIPKVIIYLMITAVILLIRISLSLFEFSEDHKYYILVQYLKVTINCYLICVLLVYGVATMLVSNVLD